MVLQTNIAPSKAIAPVVHTERVTSTDGRTTTIHHVRYPRSSVKPHLITVGQPTKLLEWCKLNKETEAINGGFFLRSSGQPLGQLWLAGREQQHVSFGSPWNDTRGSVYMPRRGKLRIAPRTKLSLHPRGDLLQAGPMLVHNGVSLYLSEADPEGFSQTYRQHDEDINSKRFPRAAIGSNRDYIWSVTVDGRSQNDAGMFLPELAEVFLQLGATEALNLDGGRSSTQISNGQLVNAPRSDFEELENGFEIFNAIIFSPAA